MADPNFIRSEAKSLSLLQKYGIESAGFDIEDIAYDLGIEIKHGGVSGGDARIVKVSDGKGVIRLNSGIHPSRVKFSVAHEIGHWELHPNISQGYLCTAMDLRDYGRSPEEAEANWFAATLLMPKFLIPVEMFKRDPSFNYIKTLASIFGTSLTAAARRFVELSKQPVLLVASTQGRILWTARSANAKYYFIKWGSALPANSLTLEVVAAKKDGYHEDRIDPHTWFQDLNFDRDSELHESVRYSPDYDSALSLLWLPS